METYAKCIHSHDEITRKRIDAAFQGAATGRGARPRGPGEEAAESLARALAAYDAKRALAAAVEATRQLMTETGVTVFDLPEDVRTALRQAEDVIGDE